jgi:hypothetical protein
MVYTANDLGGKTELLRDYPTDTSAELRTRAVIIRPRRRRQRQVAQAG